MKQLLNVLITVTFVVFGLFSIVGAYPYSGEYMFTQNGNDSNYNLTVLASEINHWFSDNKDLDTNYTIEEYAKVNYSESDSPLMTVTYNDSNLFGTWSTGNQAVEFYSVKAATNFAFYWLEGGASSGLWSTEHLLNGGGKIPTISHLTTWNSTDSTNPVPEPTTMVLFGIGLLGLAGVSRRKK